MSEEELDRFCDLVIRLQEHKLAVATLEKELEDLASSYLISLSVTLPF